MIKRILSLFGAWGVIALAGCAGPNENMETQNGMVFRFYGTFCGPGYPKLKEGLSIQEQLAELNNLKARDDLDAACKVHDMCYVRAALSTADVGASIRRCDQDLIATASEMKDKFFGLYRRFGIYSGDQLKPTEEQIESSCSDMNLTVQDFAAGLRRLYPNASPEEIAERAKRLYRAHCVSNAQVRIYRQKRQKELKLGQGLIQYRRCSVAAEGILRAFEVKSGDLATAAVAPLSLAQFGFRYVSEDGLPGKHETCNLNPDPQMQKLVDSLPKNW